MAPLLGGNQEEQSTRRGWISAGFGGCIFFLLTLLVTNSEVEDLPRGDRSSRWTIFIVVTVLMFGAGVTYLWKNAPDVMTGEPANKGQMWLAGVGIALSVTIRQLAPGLFIGVNALAAGLGLTLAVSPIVLMFIRPWARRRSSVSS